MVNIDGNQSVEIKREKDKWYFDPRIEREFQCGPVFRSDDVIYREVQIPTEFWKIAVIVKEDGNLSATAYLQSKKCLIDDLEFAYGEYKTYQVHISTIENLIGLDFGNLRKYDPKDCLESSRVHIINSSDDIII